MAALPRARRVLKGSTALPTHAPALPPVHARARAMGRKGKGSGPKIADDTARSKNLIRILHLLGEGEIELVDGGKSIYFNGTPYLRPDGTKNFDGIRWDARAGTANQTWMEGFPAVEAEVSGGNVVLDQGEPVNVALSNPALTHVRATLYLPSFQKTSDKGNVGGTTATVNLAIVDSLSVSRSATITFKLKASRGYQRSTKVALHGTGPWTMTLTKTSADPTNLNNNEVRFSSYTEIIDRKLRYPYSALVGIEADSELFGSQAPNVAFHVRGRPVRVPSNYNATTRVYTGVWDGTWQTARTKNPAWIWMDAATNKRLGAGLDDEYIDKWKLYSIAQYCDGLVPDGYGGEEPRFQCDVVINQRQEAYAVLNVLASVFRGMMFYGGGKLQVVADMPTDPTFAVAPANVEGGEIVYGDNDTSARPTVIWVSYNNREALGKQRIEVVEDKKAIDKYGYRIASAQAFACWSRGQARRVGKWLLEELWSADESAKWVGGPDHAPRVPGAIGRIADRNDTINDWGGRVVATPTSTTVQLDRAVTLASGKEYTLWLTNSDGELTEHVVASAAGTHTTLTVASAITDTILADSVWAMSQDDLSPRLFKALVVDEPKTGRYAVEAVSYDPLKYARVEQGIDFDEPTFVDLPNPQDRPEPPTNGAITRETVQGASGANEFLLIDWMAPADPIAKDFAVRYRLNDSDPVTFTGLSAPGLRIPYIPGTYEVEVFSVSLFGVWSREALEFGALIGVERTLDDATIENLRLANQDPSVNEFTGQVASFEWNVGKPSDWPDQSEGEWYDPFFASFEVTILKAADDTLLRTISTTERRFSYSFEHNKLDHGGTPERSFKVGVSFVGLDGTKTDPVYKTVTNPPPANLASLTATGTYLAAELKFARPGDTDFEGVKVWASTSSGFTPNDGTNLVYKGPQNIVRVPGLVGQTLYLRAAGYDKFGDTDLNMGSQVSAAITGAEYLGGAEAEALLDTIDDVVADAAANAAAITAETIARAAETGALATYVNSLEVSGDRALNQNPVFRNWPVSGNLPTGWSDSQTGGTRTRVAGVAPISPYAIELATAGGVNRAIFQNVTINPGWHVVELDVVYNSGALTGVGVYIDGFGNAITCASTPDSNEQVLGATPTTARRYRWRTLYKHTDATTARYILAGTHSIFGSVAAARSVTIENVRIRPADAVEIETGIARGASASLSARISTEATTAATATAAVATRATTLETQALSNTALTDKIVLRQFFTESPPTTPASSTAYTGGTAVTADNEGEVLQYGAVTTVFWTRAGLPIIGGSTYRYTCRNRTVVNGTSNVARIGYSVYDKNWALLANIIVAQPARVVADGWVNDTFEVTAASILASYATAAFIRPFVRINTTTASVWSGATSEVSRLRLENITDVKLLQAAISTVETAYIAADTALASTVTTVRARLEKKTLPSSFEDEKLFTSWAGDNLLTGTPADPTVGTFPTVTGVGKVWRSGTTAANEGIMHKGFLPLIPGHTYKHRTRYRSILDSTNGNWMTSLFQVYCYDSTGALISGTNWHNLPGSFVGYSVAEGWKENVATFTTADVLASVPNTAFIRAIFLKWSGVAPPNGQAEVSVLEMRDVTDEALIQAQVTTQAGAITTLEGKTQAYWETTLSGIAGIDAFLRARVADSNSILGFGADLIALFNRTATEWLPALKVSGGDVTVYGNLIAGKGILLGTGAKWPVALQAKQFTIADATAFYYDGGAGTLDLGSTPEFDFLTDGLDALAAGEKYDLSMSAADGIGATPRLKISTPGVTSGYSKGPTSMNSGGTPKFQLSKGADPDANGNNYVFTVLVRFSWTATSIHNGKTILYEATIPVYYKKAGVWTLAGYVYASDAVFNSGTGARTQDVFGSATITLPAAPTDFGAHNPSSSQMGWDGFDFLVSHTVAAQTFQSVTWSNTAASGTRTATPGSLTGKVIVRPKNVA